MVWFHNYYKLMNRIFNVDPSDQKIQFLSVAGPYQAGEGHEAYQKVNMEHNY